jgi:predicted nicotinamide N-methyase
MTKFNKKYLREQFGIVLPRRSHPEWQTLQNAMQKPTLHGHRLWGASRLLMDYLTQHPLEKNLRILDIGCGWGITSVFCAKQFQATVIANDADPAVFTYVDFLAQLNHCQTESLIQPFDQINTATLNTIDILIGADICFWDHLAEPVFNLIQRAVATGVKKIIIADPNRPPFIAIAEACVNEFFGEVLPWKTAIGGKVSGSILLIENA